MAKWYERFWRNNTPAVAVTVPKRKPTQYRSAFLAAQSNRLNQSWYATISGPNREVQWSIKRLRGLARQLSRNDVYAARYLELLSVNVVGPQGFQFTPRIVDSRSGDLNHTVNAALKAAWSEWAKAATLDGAMSLLDVEQLVIKTVACDGEIFVRIITGDDVNRFGVALQLLDADLLDTDYNALNVNGSSIVQGVQLNRFGRVEGYWFFNRHPDDGYGLPLTRDFVPADEILHIMRNDRVGRVRGVTWLAPAMESLGRLHDYLEAELVAAQAGASQLGMIETPANDASAYINPDAGREVVDLQPGSFISLNPGEQFKPWETNHPTTAFQPYVKQVLKGIASGLSVSYASLASDASEENYASGRMGLLTERAQYKNVQSLLMRLLHYRLYPKWIEAAIWMGAIDLPTNNPHDYLDVIFRPQGFMWADPLRELKAYESSVANNLTSKTLVCALNGLDYRDVLDERYEEIKLEAEYRKALEDIGLGAYVQGLTNASPAIVEAKPTVNESENDEEKQT